MCLGIPVKVLEVSEGTATVEVGGARREISVMLVDGVRAGDWVILHAGFAINRIDEDEAQKTLELFRKISDAAETA